MKEKAFYCTAKEVSDAGFAGLNPRFQNETHLIYSSPATLAFNSPGAEGFGVKRAGLAVPGSVMLLVSPGCCGRNTQLVSAMPAYDGRFFYLTLDEKDIVTGRHLSKIPEAVEEICETLDPRPSVVMICITCVDALLGTDMESICKKAEEKARVPVRPCYMYALTREGRRPPMVQVRQSVYSLLKPRKRKGNVVNLLGFFSPVDPRCELFALLKQAGVKTVHEISTCRDFDEYLTMAEANFNLVLYPEARLAAGDFTEKLGIPYIELRRFYETDRIARQYQAFGAAIGVTFDDESYAQQAKEAVGRVKKACPDAVFAVGECMNGDPFELSLALVRYGFSVAEIFGTVTEENFIYIRQLAKMSPDTKIYANSEPSMLTYAPEDGEVDLAVGKDAVYYHPEVPGLLWNQELQPYGYLGVQSLFEELLEVLG